MELLVSIDNEIGRRGRVVVSLIDNAEEMDRELVLKHPFLLRLRVLLAAKRIVHRHRKLEKSQERLHKLSAHIVK